MYSRHLCKLPITVIDTKRHCEISRHHLRSHNIPGKHTFRSNYIEMGKNFNERSHFIHDSTYLKQTHFSVIGRKLAAHRLDYLSNVKERVAGISNIMTYWGTSNVLFLVLFDLEDWQGISILWRLEGHWK